MDYCNKKIIIAIDGFSSCGKSTFAKEIAAKLGYIFIDTGAMYRVVTLYAMENGGFDNCIPNEQKIVGMLDDIDITFRLNSTRGASDIYVNGDLAQSKIRSMAVSNLVSAVSGIAQVRNKLVALQQQIGRCASVVMDGRDIGTVVFPNADLKIFMTADPEVRAKRRYEELKAKGSDVSLKEITKNIIDRDNADQNRAVSPLRKADDAIVLDNSHMTLEDQMKWFDEIFDKISGKQNNNV